MTKMALTLVPSRNQCVAYDLYELGWNRCLQLFRPMYIVEGMKCRIASTGSLEGY